MFARKVSARLTPNSLPEFTHLIEYEVLPWLRRQEGFLDLIILALPDCREVATISFWEQQANAEAYSASGFPQVLEVLGRLLDGVPYVKTFEVVSSTFQRAIPIQPAEAGHLPETGVTKLGYGSTETSV